MDSPSRLVVVGLPTLIHRCLSTTFESGQRCNFRIVLIIPRITFSHRKQSMPFPRPRHGLFAVTLFSSIQTTKFGLTAGSKVSRLHVTPSHLLISQFGFRASYRPSATYFSCRPIQKSPRFSWYRFISRVCSMFRYCTRLPPTGQGQSNQKGPYPGPSTGMHLLKCARRTDRSNMGDIVPLAQLQTLVDLVLRFGKQAKR
jgi:hypothetical protein